MNATYLLSKVSRHGSGHGSGNTTTTNSKTSPTHLAGGVPGPELGPENSRFFHRKPASKEPPCIHFCPPVLTYTPPSPPPASLGPLGLLAHRRAAEAGVAGRRPRGRPSPGGAFSFCRSAGRGAACARFCSIGEGFFIGGGDICHRGGRGWVTRGSRCVCCVAQ
jgi:hypothetical protein